MFEKLETPNDVFTYKLGAALKMEHTVLEMLGKLEEEAQRADLKALFRHHADETRTHVQNLEQAFTKLGVEPDDKPCPAIEGIDKEGKANIKKAADQMVDAVILSGAAETEHHEIAVYEGLITKAEAMGKRETVNLLRRNLEQEQHTLEEVNKASQRSAQQLAYQAT